MEAALPLRITLVSAPAGVQFCLQRGKDEHVSVQLATGGDLHFDFDVRAQLAGADGLRLLGPYTQGPPSARFVYLCVGKLAGQPNSPWTRRIKVPLNGITAELAGLTGPSAAAGELPRLSARISGTGKDGTPACATVPLLGSGWQHG